MTYLFKNFVYYLKNLVLKDRSLLHILEYLKFPLIGYLGFKIYIHQFDLKCLSNEL